jgi:hypothetical protein
MDTDNRNRPQYVKPFPLGYPAKRLECAELAPAFEGCCASHSGSKLRALQTLRAVVAPHPVRLCPSVTVLDYCASGLEPLAMSFFSTAAGFFNRAMKIMEAMIKGL